MSLINWIRVLTSHNIEYVERGPNVKRGEVNIKCPFCGQADPSHHMGLNLTTGYWACWRNQNHRGKSPLRLLVRLLRCSYQRACDIAGVTNDYVDPDGFDSVAARVMQRDGLQRVEEVRRDFLALPKDFKPLRPSGATRRHWNYMVNERGFRENDLEFVSDFYTVFAAVGGDYHDRIIFTYTVGGEVVAWSGRAIAEAVIRYRDLPLDQCLIPPKQTLYNYDGTQGGGAALLVVEGPMDALKLDFYAFEWGVRAVALSTNSITENQIYLLEELSLKFDRTLVMMDNVGELSIIDSIRMKEKLSQIHNLSFARVPFGRKDGGDMTPDEVVHYARSLT